MNDLIDRQAALKWFEARLKNGVPMPAARSAFQAAIEALKEQDTNKWVSCSERMPELREDVLICLTHGEFVVSFLDKDFHDKTFWAYGLNSNDVVAWMPIPEYKGDNK